MPEKRCAIVVIGGSAGAMTALGQLLSALPDDYPLPILIAIHLHPLQDKYYLDHFNELCALPVKEADEKEPIQGGHIYFAPPNYHLLIEKDLTFSLSVDEKVNYARPSIDILFESAADAYAPHLAGIILTGANNDGALGLNYIKNRGGTTIVQDPQTADSPYMPKAALSKTPADYILTLQEIGDLLVKLPKLHG
jgi:two-component system chemotaxis response regulator CheB